MVKRVGAGTIDDAAQNFEYANLSIEEIAIQITRGGGHNAKI